MNKEEEEIDRLSELECFVRNESNSIISLESKMRSLESTNRKLIKALDDLEKRHTRLIENYNQKMKYIAQYIRTTDKEIDQLYTNDNHLHEQIIQIHKLIMHLLVQDLRIASR